MKEDTRKYYGIKCTKCDALLTVNYMEGASHFYKIFPTLEDAQAGMSQLKGMFTDDDCRDRLEVVEINVSIVSNK